MISCNASTEARVGKPFNPLLGETFELERYGKLNTLYLSIYYHL